jgi:carbohydrate kinase (thermoresistant glucokinase family)
MSTPAVVIVMGVSGAGKTTVGRALARRLGWSFIEGDDFHPAANIELMAAGHPHTDADRAPWLAALRAQIEHIMRSGDHAVIACSALKHRYRSVLAGQDSEAVRFVQLDVPRGVLEQRLAHRHGHFMPPSLLDSQLATLEESTTALRVDGTQPVESLVDQIAAWLSR